MNIDSLEELQTQFPLLTACMAQIPGLAKEVKVAIEQVSADERESCAQIVRGQLEAYQAQYAKGSNRQYWGAAIETAETIIALLLENPSDEDALWGPCSAPAIRARK